MTELYTPEVEVLPKEKGKSKDAVKDKAKEKVKAKPKAKENTGPGLGARLKKALARKSKQKPDELGAVSQDKPILSNEDPPFILLVGSLTGVSIKDARLYVEGLAEKFVTSPRLARVHLQVDKARNRILYEIHEGGPGYSILARLMERLQTQKSVRIALANEAHVEISDEFGELVTLHFPAGTNENLGGSFNDETQTPYVALDELCGRFKLPELFPERKTLPIMGGALMVSGALILLGSALTFALTKNGYFDSDPVLTMSRQQFPPSVADNPLWQMERAKTAATREGAFISKLEKVDGKWSWKLKPVDLGVLEELISDDTYAGAAGSEKPANTATSAWGKGAMAGVRAGAAAAAKATGAVPVAPNGSAPPLPPAPRGVTPGAPALDPALARPITENSPMTGPVQLKPPPAQQRTPLLEAAPRQDPRPRIEQRAEQQERMRAEPVDPSQERAALRQRALEATAAKARPQTQDAQ